MEEGWTKWAEERKGGEKVEKNGSEALEEEGWKVGRKRERERNEREKGVVQRGRSCGKLVKLENKLVGGAGRTK